MKARTAQLAKIKWFISVAFYILQVSVASVRHSCDPFPLCLLVYVHMCVGIVPCVYVHVYSHFPVYVCVHMCTEAGVGGGVLITLLLSQFFH